MIIIIHYVLRGRIIFKQKIIILRYSNKISEYRKPNTKQIQPNGKGDSLEILGDL